MKQMTPANTGDPALDLLAAIVMRAILDAQGSGELAWQAAQWLDDVCPRWRKTSQQNGQISTKTANGYIDAH